MLLSKEFSKFLLQWARRGAESSRERNQRAKPSCSQELFRNGNDNQPQAADNATMGKEDFRRNGLEPWSTTLPL
jgi:hypothetical protein